MGFVRFGWRDYDTFTGRWTAPDPIGDRGGDPDWYGYCLDDPVNAADPLGLKGGFWGGVNKIGAGLGQLWVKAPAGIGEAVTKGAKGAGEALSKTAEAFATNKDLKKIYGDFLGGRGTPHCRSSWHGSSASHSRGGNAAPGQVGSGIESYCGLCIRFF